MVLYYDVFRHPLRVAELERLCGGPVGPAVRSLEERGLVERVEDHICLPGGAGLVPRRRERSVHAERRWPVALKAASALARFPWIRAVFVTGGLSKQSAEEGADVDFLLLVEPGRIWAAKSALQVVRRVLPEAIRDCLCTNYLLATDALSLSDRNLFTAMELATAVPLHGAAHAVALLEANRAWAERLVPGFDWSVTRARNAPTLSQPAPTRLFEAGFSPLAPAVERFGLAAWDRYWNRKYAWVETQDRAHRFQRGPSVATNHLHDFQRYVLDEYARRCAQHGLAPA